MLSQADFERLMQAVVRRFPDADSFRFKHGDDRNDEDENDYVFVVQEGQTTRYVISFVERDEHGRVKPESVHLIEAGRDSVS